MDIPQISSANLFGIKDEDLSKAVSKMSHSPNEYLKQGETTHLRCILRTFCSHTFSHPLSQKHRIMFCR